MQKKVVISFDEKLCHTNVSVEIPLHEKVNRKKVRLSAFEQVERLTETKTLGGAQQLNYERFWVRKENLWAADVLTANVKSQVKLYVVTEKLKISSNVLPETVFVSSISLDIVVKKKFCVSKEE